MYFIVTIDTEEDEWGEYSLSKYNTKNIKALPFYQNLFEKYNIKPTYLISYPVATNNESVGIIKEMIRDGKCEIGTHCHPWNTPPLEETRVKENSMLCNLPFELQYEKIKTLHQAIIDNFGVEPISFRSGRWGFDQNVGRNLYRLGYKVDTSVTPFTNWNLYHGPDFSCNRPFPYRMDISNNGDCKDKYILEIPVSIGFSQYNFNLSSWVHKFINSKYINKSGIIGITSRLNILNKIWLSPEICNSKDMIKLTKSLKFNGCKILNMTFHSPSMKAGLSPFVKNKSDEDTFVRKIEEYLKYVRETGITSITLSDAILLDNIY